MKAAIQKDVINQLKRIEGQIRGLQKMVENEDYCIDIITQSQAAKSSLSAVENAMLENHLSTHVLDQIKAGKEDKAIEEILKVYKLKDKRS